MSTSTHVSAAPTASAAVLIIGGAVVDMVYQSTNASATASSMFATSTPCRLARLSCGGVGRNIGEALGRLFASTPTAVETSLTDADQRNKHEQRVELRTVVGGTSSSRSSVNGVVEATVPDNNGSMLLRELDRIVSECATCIGRRDANEVNGPHLGAGSGNSLDAANVRTSAAFSYSCCVIEGEQTASYVATLDSRGELVSAAAVMGIFNEEHFSPEVALKGTSIDPMEGREATEKGLQSTTATTCTTSSLDHTWSLPFVGNASPRNGSEATKNASLTLPQWVVLDGNVPQRTLEQVCRAVSLKNNSTRTDDDGEKENADDTKDNEGRRKERKRRTAQKIRIALDPISKEKVLRSINVLDCIDLMKPNEYEAIALATALACGAESADASQHRFTCTVRSEREMKVTNITATEQKEEEKKKADNPMPNVNNNNNNTNANALSTHLIEQTADSLRVALRGWQRRHNDKKKGTLKQRYHVYRHDSSTSSPNASAEMEMMGETRDGGRGEFGQASVPKTHEIPQKNLECDETFRGIVRMCLAVSRRRHDTKHSAADSGVSTLIADASHVLWEVYGRLTKSERDTLALVAACYIVCVGRVGHVLCTLGEGGCWSVRREGTFTISANGKRREPEIDKFDTEDEGLIMIRRIRSIPIPPSKLVKVTGAGDSFLSGYLFGLSVGAPSAVDAMTAEEDSSTRGNPPHKPDDGTIQSNDQEVNHFVTEEAFAERCASLAAVSALVSAQSTINPNIQQFVLDKDYYNEHFLCGEKRAATSRPALHSKL